MYVREFSAFFKRLLILYPVALNLKSAKKGCILFVDDEELVLLSGANLLRSMSYEVISASDGMEALDLYNRDKEKISLAIIDLIMPKISGLELFGMLKKINPGLEIILCSGLCTEETEYEVLNSGASAVIMKPYTSADLSSVLEKIEKKKTA